MYIQEMHEHEQYFFDKETLEKLASFVKQFTNPCCLCAPMLGKFLADQGSKVTILDIDDRFAQVKGFQHYDVFRPKTLNEKFDLIFCDPPFFRVSLSQLFHCVRVLAHFDFNQPVAITYLERRSAAITGAFAPFKLEPIDTFATYQTVKQGDNKNFVQVFANVNSGLVD